MVSACKLMRSNLTVLVEQVSVVECQGKIIFRIMRAAPSVNRVREVQQ